VGKVAQKRKGTISAAEGAGQQLNSSTRRSSLGEKRPRGATSGDGNSSRKNKHQEIDSTSAKNTKESANG